MNSINNNCAVLSHSDICSTCYKLAMLCFNSYFYYFQLLTDEGYEVVRIDPLRFLAGCRNRRLNQALSVLSVSLGYIDAWQCCVAEAVLPFMTPSFCILCDRAESAVTRH